jgi:hypothetical protein
MREELRLCSNFKLVAFRFVVAFQIPAISKGCSTNPIDIPQVGEDVKSKCATIKAYERATYNRT